LHENYILRTGSQRQSKSEGNNSLDSQTEESKTSDPSTPPMDQDIVNSQPPLASKSAYMFELLQRRNAIDLEL
jgi:hypothetical protein